MLAEFFESPLRIQELRDCPDGRLLEGFAQELHEVGYAQLTARRHLRAAEHLIYWTGRNGPPIAALDERFVEQFSHHLDGCRCPRYGHTHKLELQNGARLFIDYLRSTGVERRASPNTCDSYAHAFRLLFEYASDGIKVPPSQLHLEHIDAPLIVNFLNHLEITRGNGAGSRNIRLAAIKSFMHYMEFRVPSALEQIQRILAIPAKKADSRLEPQTSVLIHGKGRKERCLPLWKETASALRAWLSVRGEVRVPERFLSARNEALTRAGFEYILQKHVRTAEKLCPSLSSKRVSPHVLRHTCALTILQATKDLRKVSLRLGHSSMQTTEIYTRADPTVKLETLESVIAPNRRTGRYKATDKLIALLKATQIMRSENTSI